MAVALFRGFECKSLGQNVTLSEIKRLPNGQVQMKVSGTASGAVSIQASVDMRTWQDLQSLTLGGAPVYFTDIGAVETRTRAYRVRSSGGSSAPVQLPDLADMTNRVFPAPEGCNTVQFAPDGTLGLIAWRDQSLILRERDSAGSWREQVVTGGGNVFKMLLVFDFSGPREDYRFQPSAVLLYDNSSRPHVFEGNGREILHFTRDGSGNWNVAERISNPQANGNVAVLEGAIGPNNVFHFAALSSGSPRKLTYGSNRSGSWAWTTLSPVVDPPLTYWPPPFAARWLSMDVDAQNAAHIAFRSSLDLTYDSASHPRAYSELKYASNSSGSWRTTTVQTPRDSSGEAANGASIAVGPDNRPRIVSWYDERADTGSAQESRLYFHQQDGAGNWSGSIVSSTPDGYVAGDGPKGTGFSPYLRYDRSGRAHIVFLDHAGEHFSGIGQQEYAGNVRHAWWNGSGWSFDTLFRQSAALQGEVVYPAFAVSSGELALTFLQRDTQWNLGSFPPLSNSRYYFRVQTVPLR